jgi:nucleoside-diphosphate-sugar epimerase
MRFRRGSGAPAAVAVTGAADGLGRALLERLAARRDAPPVVGVDTGTAPVPGAEWRSADVRDPLLAERLSGVGTVVHLAVCYDPGLDATTRQAVNVRGTASMLEACRVAGVRRVVLVTSVDVYGPRPGRSTAPGRPLTERSPLRAQPDDSLTGDLIELERLADHATRTGLAVTVLRPAALVAGALGPSYDGGLLRHLSAPRLLAVRGVEPLWQLCHVDDLLSALELAALGAATGRLTVACEGWLPQTAVETMTGRRRLELPATVAISTAERLHRLRVTSGSPRELDLLLAPIVVTCGRLRAAGWQPRWTNEAALRSHLATRPTGGAGSAPYTAAGAAVALVGTAALVRRTRRRRRL